MDFLKKIFPLSMESAEKDNFIKAIVIYAIAIFGSAIVGWVVGSLLGGIPIVGRIITTLVGATIAVVDIYATAGIALAILVFVKVLK